MKHQDINPNKKQFLRDAINWFKTIHEENLENVIFDLDSLKKYFDLPIGDLFINGKTEEDIRKDIY